MPFPGPSPALLPGLLRRKHVPTDDSLLPERSVSTQRRAHPSDFTPSQKTPEGVCIKGHLGKGTRWAALCLTLVLCRVCVVVRALSPGYHNRPTQEPA